MNFEVITLFCFYWGQIAWVLLTLTLFFWMVRLYLIKGL